MINSKATNNLSNTVRGYINTSITLDGLLQLSNNSISISQLLRQFSVIRSQSSDFRLKGTNLCLIVSDVRISGSSFDCFGHVPKLNNDFC